jgi:hypothetical protein
LHKFQIGLHSRKYKVCLFKWGLIGFYGFFHYNTFNYLIKRLMKSNGYSCGTTLATMSIVDCMTFKSYLLSLHNIYTNCKLWCTPKICFSCIKHQNVDQSMLEQVLSSTNNLSGPLHIYS